MSFHRLPVFLQEGLIAFLIAVGATLSTVCVGDIMADTGVKYTLKTVSGLLSSPRLNTLEICEDPPF